MQKKIIFKSVLVGTILFGCNTISKKTNKSQLASADDVRDYLQTATQDGELTLAEIQGMFSETGTWVGDEEGMMIYNAVMQPDSSYQVRPDTVAAAKEWALFRGLSDAEIQALRNKKTLAGIDIPEEVIEVLSKAKLSGAISYDVDYTSAGDTEPRFSPHYSSTPEATENMSWQYTQIIPHGLKEDINFTGSSQWRTSAKTDSSGSYWQYETKQGGTGLIVGTYDEIHHSDIFARTENGAKWAHNCAVLGDGSFHCLPASRRNMARDHVLVNPDLSRQSRMMYNGHIEAKEGLIYEIELSGKLAKLSSRGSNVFINPVCLLKAWGYSDTEIDGIRLYFDSNGRPERVPSVHEETCTLRSNK